MSIQKSVVLLLAVTAFPFATIRLQAQGRGTPQPPKSPKEAAPVDLTGYWVANITTDWRWRMTLPPKGDYRGVPLNAEGLKVANAWDSSRDEAAGEQCRSYGAPNIMHVPGRIHITWQDDRTLKLETDAGRQTRLFYFGAPLSRGGDEQGVSQAFWDVVSGGRGLTTSGSLKVVTTKFKPGYLRKNGVPYSANGTLTEFYDLVKEPNGDQFLVVSITFDDPTYLTAKYETAVDFKKQSDGTGWNPSPCTSK